MAKKTVKKKASKKRTQRKAGDKPIERNLIEVELRPKDVPDDKREELAALLKSATSYGHSYIQMFPVWGPWEPYLIEGPIEAVQERLKILKEFFKEYERVEIKLSYEWDDNDGRDTVIKLLGYRWETDAEFEKRREILLKRREADWKRRDEKKRAAAAEKRSAEEREYQKYLELKEKFKDREGD